MNITTYLSQITSKHATGQATEHSYRGFLEQYLYKLYQQKISITNEPKRQACGAPDFILYKQLRRNSIPVGYIEAKDIGKPLDDLANGEQLTRYKQSLDNLIFTDYIDFIFYKKGEQVARIAIAKLDNKQLIPLKENFTQLESLLANFVNYQGQTIKSAKTLASIMAQKAKIMRHAFNQALQLEDDTPIKQQFKAFKHILLHDITFERFANIYAQTITCGLFTARLHDTTLEDFSREEAYSLIPKTNPFLHQLFKYVAIDIEEDIKWAVDELCEVFRATNVKAILSDFGKSSGRRDPIIHFYEDFLTEFDPEIRKARGVWYTPEPVVNFIIRGLDYVLKHHFDLKQGLADSSKSTIKIATNQQDGRTKTGIATATKEIHTVQLLDIATGTGSFTSEVIKHIYHNHYQGQEGLWQTYVDESLLPRLHGFEILMASYAMCNLKIDLLLQETGYKPHKGSPRLGMYLTNALEEHHPDAGTLFAHFLSSEANAASKIKSETPVMVALGNPPYSVSSQNKGQWIQEQIKVYKQDLNERNINSLSDDYIKFMRMAEHYIAKTGYGVVAMITNNSFLDGITHRQMRKHLLETFDTIYIYDLHGSSKKQEIAPDGSKDENVFDIMQGVSINIFVKDNNNKNKLADVYHYDAYGSRKDKYQQLHDSSLDTVAFTKLAYQEPYYFFAPKDFSLAVEYDNGFSVNNLLMDYNSGIQTKRDALFIDDDKANLSTRIKTLLNQQYDENFIQQYNIKDSSSYKLTKVIQGKSFSEEHIQKIQYRSFDNKYIYYDTSIISRSASKAMQHMLSGENWGLCLMRSLVNTSELKNVFLSNTLMDLNFYGFQTYLLPLYLYPEDNSPRQPNLNPELIKGIEQKLGLPFIADHDLPAANNQSNFSPLDLLDYIYAVLHCPSYRNKYKEFLKINFPRVPYPADKENFWQLVALGGQLRRTHLLEGEKFNSIKNLITQYPIAGNNTLAAINKKSFVLDAENLNLGRVYINQEQYFANVPIVAWEFYIGGYQPAQKWLKDRKSRELNHDDILHYQKIILALTTTHQLMQKIDSIIKI